LQDFMIARSLSNHRLSVYPLVAVCLLIWGQFSCVLAEDFLQFRGSGGQGHSTEKGLPLTWSENENIAWKVPVPGLGWSSPAIGGTQLWLTTASEEGKSLRALCYDVHSGKPLHDVEVIRQDDPGAIHHKNSHASPTPLIDGQRVFVHFGGFGTGCVSTRGELLWTTRELKYAHQHGPGGSPVVYKNLLLLNCDGTDVQFVVALDKATGRVVWKTPRQHISAERLRGEKNAAMGFSTPLLVEVQGRTQLVSTGADHVAAYDPQTGEEIWWSTYDGYSLVPRPVYGHGLLFICSGFNRPVLYAIRPDGRGDVTSTHVAWSLDRAAPLTPSPLLVGAELYLVSDAGIATCLDAVTGRQHWQERLGGNFSASPLFADGRIYFLDERGTTTVIAPGTKFQLLARNALQGRTLASLATADGAIFLRSDTHLYRIAK
jgi:outer membrane protein assembly factor BamB